MEKIAQIVERLNLPPFSKKIGTMTELDGKSSLELLELMCEIVTNIDPEQESIFKETIEFRVRRIIQFLVIMKFNIPEDQMDDFQGLMLAGDKEILHTIMHWCLQRFDHLQKRAYLAKYLMPVEIPAEFLGEDLIIELSQRLKELQMDFKEIHKTADQVRNSGTKPSDLKAEVLQLEQEKTQLQNKIAKMRKDMTAQGHDEDYFRDMLKATSALRKEQENEVAIHERQREHRKAAQEADLRFSDATKRFSELKRSGVQTQSAEQILSKLHADVKELNDRRENVDRIIAEREQHLEKLQSWDNTDRITTDEDVRMKREQVQDLQDTVKSLSERLEGVMNSNTGLIMFKAAKSSALTKYRDRENEVDRLSEELRRVNKQTDDKENELKAKGGASGKIGKRDLKKYGAIVREKIDGYKKMREELAALRAEQVVLQSTEQTLRSRHTNLDAFLSDLERQKGVEGYRDTQRALVEMTEKASEVDRMKGATLEEISLMVEQIGREFKNKQTQLQPLIMELKNVRQEYMDVESQYQERKSTYDKVAVGLEMEKQSLEKDCNTFQDECLREESRYHCLQHLIAIAKIKLDRAEQEKRWQSGDGRMIRDFASFKDLYAHKMTQQEQLTKQLRRQQKELKENSGALTNQKTNFVHLQMLLDMKLKCEQDPSSGGGRGGSAGGDVFTPAYAEPAYNMRSDNKGGRADRHDVGGGAKGESMSMEKEGDDDDYYYNNRGNSRE